MRIFKFFCLGVFPYLGITAFCGGFKLVGNLFFIANAGFMLVWLFYMRRVLNNYQEEKNVYNPGVIPPLKGAIFNAGDIWLNYQLRGKRLYFFAVFHILFYGFGLYLQL